MLELNLTKEQMTQEEISKRLESLASRLVKMETAIFGINGSGGMYKEVTEMREEIKKHAKFQNLLLGALIVVNFIVPFIFKFVLGF